MSYNLQPITTIAGCDALINQANNEKANEEFRITSLEHQMSNKSAAAEALPAELNAVTTQLTAMTTAADLLPEGNDKMQLLIEVNNLETKKMRIEMRIENNGPEWVVDTKKEIKLAEAAVVVLAELITELQARKAELTAAGVAA